MVYYWVPLALHFSGLQLQPAVLCHLSTDAGLEKLHPRRTQDGHQPPICTEIPWLHNLRVWETKMLQKVESVVKATGMPHGVPAKKTSRSKLHLPHSWGDLCGSSLGHSFNCPLPCHWFSYLRPQMPSGDQSAEPMLGVDWLISPP